MKAGLKKKWLAALRSGKYKQGKWWLHNANDEYCCMGVLACIVGKDVHRGSLAGTLDDVGIRGLGKFSRKRDGQFSANDPKTHTTLQRKLSAMNDTGKTFKQIANWISRNV